MENTILSLLALIVAITIHEFAHALAADKLGDPTPRSQGRLSLNPIKHLDPIGTLMILFARFGWGKPVPIDPYNLKNPRRDELLISLAGPLSNLLLALATSLLIRSFSLYLIPLYILVAVNVSLAIFNLLPIPPLDGSKIFLNLLPIESSAEWEDSLTRYGPILLIIVLFFPINGSNIVGLILSPIIQTILNTLLP
ncbi:MAG: site-2 protease family protein [Patescibacteria group bacterium]|jgi:Zn-dependent protease